MNYSKAIFIVSDDVIGARIQYDPGAHSNEYDVVKTFDRSIKKDDLVVVESGTRHGMTTAKVLEVDVDVDPEDALQMKWLVCRIPVEEHAQLLAKETAMIEQLKSAQRAAARREMRAKLFADQEEQMAKLAIDFESPVEE